MMLSRAPKRASAGFPCCLADLPCDGQSAVPGQGRDGTYPHDPQGYSHVPVRACVSAAHSPSGTGLRRERHSRDNPATSGADLSTTFGDDE